MKRILIGIVITLGFQFCTGELSDDISLITNINVTWYNFEDGTTQGLDPDNCSDYPNACAERSTNPVRNGNYALKFTLQGTKGERSEITLNKPISMDTDYWIGFSIYLLKWDNSSSNSVVYQTHRTSGQPGSSPIIGLRATGSEWKLTEEFDSSDSKTIWSGSLFNIITGLRLGN